MSRDPLDLLGDLPDFPGKTPPKNRKGSPPRLSDDPYHGARPVVYKVKGVDTEFFTVGELAKALGRKASTLRVWEHYGWIPKTSFRSPVPMGKQLPDKTSKGRRLYTVSQLLFLTEAAERFKINYPKHSKWDEFREHVALNWPKE
jgi:hypothetical protein